MTYTHEDEVRDLRTQVLHTLDTCAETSRAWSAAYEYALSHVPLWKRRRVRAAAAAALGASFRKPLVDPEKFKTQFADPRVLE